MALKHPSHPSATAADTPPPAMSRPERRAVAALSGIFSLRMLGLFMFLPVFSVHAHEYAGHTPLLIGVAIGIYGLTQGVFQVPFGILSDRFGRKPVIAAGLVIFALGSVVAALADGIWGVVAGRALQGLGAVAAAVMALASDLTGEAHRTKAMAVIGVSIGAAFALALVLGPAVTGVAGVSGLFWTTAVLAAAAVALLYLGVPDPPRVARSGGTPLADLASVLRDGQMLRLDAGIFILHAVMIATFVALPIALRDRAGIDARSTGSLRRRARRLDRLHRTPHRLRRPQEPLPVARAARHRAARGGARGARRRGGTGSGFGPDQDRGRGG